MAPARAGLPDSRTQPSHPSVSTHLRMLRLVRARYPSTDRTEIASPRVFSQRELGASSFVSRLAASHRPYRVPYRTDEQFTSCCSPPRVATTQLQADYKLRCLEEDFHLSDRVRSQAHWHGRPGHDRTRAGSRVIGTGCPGHAAWGERSLAQGPNAVRPYATAESHSALHHAAPAAPPTTGKKAPLATQPPRDTLPHNAYRQFPVRG